jgi:hypothetical protein
MNCKEKFRKQSKTHVRNSKHREIEMKKKTKKKQKNRVYVKENKKRGLRKKERESTGPKTGFGLLVHLPKLLVPYGEHTKPLVLLL